jgi:uncharacterized protein (DUF924 family)
VSGDWRADVLKFWFGLGADQWWNGPPELDHRIKQQFLKLWAEKRQLPVDAFLDDPLTALAGVILFDQLPRNMFRGDAEQFATDQLALAIAKGAVEQKLDEKRHLVARRTFGRRGKLRDRPEPGLQTRECFKKPREPDNHHAERHENRSIVCARIIAERSPEA